MCARAALAERHHAQAGLRIRQRDGVDADIAPAQIGHFAAAAPGERQQPVRGDGLGPSARAGVEREARMGQFVRVEEPGDLDSSNTYSED